MTRIKAGSLPTALVLLGLLSGCAMPAWTGPAGPERFQVGYRDGCDAGYAVAGSPFYERIAHGVPAYDDRAYADGWEDGFSDCKRSYDRVQMVIHSVLGNGS